MNDPRPESPTNILALVALAALLIFAAAVIGSMETTPPSWISPEAEEVSGASRVSRNSQVAAVTPVSTGAAPATVIPAAGAAAPAKPAELTDNPKPVTLMCGLPPKAQTVHYACAQVGNIEKITALKQAGCNSPGFEYTITSDSKGNVRVTPRSLAPSAPGCPAPPPQKCTSGTAIASFSTECKVKFCVEAEVLNSYGLSKSKSGCFDVKNPSGKSLYDVAKDPDNREGAAGILARTLTFDEATKVLPELKSDLSKADQDAFSQAFTERQAEIQKQVMQNNTKIADFQRIIDNPDDYGANISEVNATKADLAALVKQNAELDKQVQSLAAAQTGLTASPCGSEICASGKILGPDDKPLDERYRPAPVKDNNTFPPPETPPVGGGGGGGDGGLAQFLQGFMKSLFGGGGAPPAGNQTPKAPGTCSPQTMCSNGTLFSRSNQCVDTPIQQCPNGCAGNTCAQASKQPVAQLSCQPQIADVGMSIAITYACSAGMSVGSGFDTGGASSGATTATLTTPPIGTNTASYGLTCTNQGLSANASCSVQIGKPSIVLVTNPKTVPMNTASAIGWVTAGMQSCVIGSPDLPDFTSANAGNTNVNGAVTTPALTGPARFILHCVTLGGGTRDASSTIEVAGVAGAVSLAISKPTAGQNVALGGTVQIAWNSEGAPSGAKMRLEVYPAGSAVVQGNNDKGIVSALPASGTFTWSLPAAGAACLADSGIISCLTPGQYKIVAKLYTGSECWGFCTAAASERTIRVVAESSVFTIAP